MSTEQTPATPPVVTAYLAAADAGDVPALLACFTAGATVHDEGRTYRGHDEIRGWREGAASAFSYTTTVTGSEATPAGHLVRVRLEGDFPGGVADLAFRFTLRGGLVTELAIGG